MGKKHASQYANFGWLRVNALIACHGFLTYSHFVN